MSTNNWFAENIATNLNSIESIDFTDTIKAHHRSDLCMGCAAILNACIGHKLQTVIFDDNDLEEDGARAFNSFLGETKSLRVLRANNCGLSDKSCQMILKAIE